MIESDGMPLWQRLLNIVTSFTLLIWGGNGLYHNDLSLPSRVAEDGFNHIQDGPLIMLFSSFVCFSLLLMSEVIAHYHKNKSKKVYFICLEIFSKLGWTLLLISLVYSALTIVFIKV